MMRRIPARTILALTVLAASTGCTESSPEAVRETPTPPGEAPAELPRAIPHRDAESGQLGRLPDGVGISIGQPAPDARVQDADGRPVQLRDLFARGPVMLVFYRGGWCPFCNFQIRELTEHAADFERLGVTPVAISVDRMEESARTRATYAIPFPVLSDPDLSAHRAYRVIQELDAAEVERLRGGGMDLERSSGRAHHTIAIPSVFVVENGVVRWVHADRDYRTRPSTAQLLSALGALDLGERD